MSKAKMQKLVARQVHHDKSKQFPGFFFCVIRIMDLYISLMQSVSDVYTTDDHYLYK